MNTCYTYNIHNISKPYKRCINTHLVQMHTGIHSCFGLITFQKYTDGLLTHSHGTKHLTNVLHTHNKAQSKPLRQPEPNITSWSVLKELERRREKKRESTHWQQFMVFWQGVGQSLQTIIVLQHIITFSQTLLITTLKVILHCIQPVEHTTVKSLCQNSNNTIDQFKENSQIFGYT